MQCTSWPKFLIRSDKPLHKVFNEPACATTSQCYTLTLLSVYSITTCEYLPPGHTFAGDAYRELLTRGWPPIERQGWSETTFEPMLHAVTLCLWSPAG